MTWYYGAAHDLERLISTHLFIICPNNSGSTFLKNVLTTSCQTWNLVTEGQLIPGFSGPNIHKFNAGKLWATEQYIEKFLDVSAYNWPLTRRAWYFQAFSRNPQASVFVEKSPPFLLNVPQLIEHFRNPRFIFMVRDPYTTVEGIRRRRRKNRPPHVIPREEDLLKLAASHVVTCFQYQRRNIETFDRYGIFFTYEKMCDEPERVERLIKSLLPELGDLVIRQRLAVKDYDEMLRNMNAQQLSNLSREELDWINEVFEKQSDLLEYFGYPLRTSILK